MPYEPTDFEWADARSHFISRVELLVLTTCASCRGQSRRAVLQRALVKILRPMNPTRLSKYSTRTLSRGSPCAVAGVGA
jgi:hypothetical protein